MAKKNKKTPEKLPAGALIGGYTRLTRSAGPGTDAQILKFLLSGKSSEEIHEWFHFVGRSVTPEQIEAVRKTIPEARKRLETSIKWPDGWDPEKGWPKVEG